MEVRPIKKKVINSGDIGVGRCLLYEESKTISVVVIETTKKYCVIQGYGSDENNTPSIIYSASDTSDKYTEVLFPEYTGWDFFCASVSKYDIHACLIKR